MLTEPNVLVNDEILGIFNDPASQISSPGLSRQPGETQPLAKGSGGPRRPFAGPKPCPWRLQGHPERSGHLRQTAGEDQAGLCVIPAYGEQGGPVSTEPMTH